MKKIIALIGLAALCAGCSHSNDSAKIDALNQKVDLLIQNQSVAISNEVVLFNEIGTVKNQITNLPDLAHIDGMAFYYHTNEMDEVRGRFNAIDRADYAISEQGDWLTGTACFMMTNKLNGVEASDDNYNRLFKEELEIEKDDSMIEFYLTNPPPTGPVYDGLEKIMVRLGIY